MYSTYQNWQTFCPALDSLRLNPFPSDSLMVVPVAFDFLLTRAWFLAIRRHETHSALHAKLLDQEGKGESPPKAEGDTESFELLEGHAQEIKGKEHACAICNVNFGDLKRLRS